MKFRMLVPWLLALSVLAYQYAPAQAQADLFYQVSTMSALKKGLYHGYVSYADLRKKGDFGIGTVDGLDGEMVAVDGEFFQIRADGKAYPIPDTATTPFAVVMFFKPQIRGVVQSAGALPQLQDALDRLIPCKEVPYAIKVTGLFSLAHVRSVPRQNEPYPELKAALQHQVEFDLRKVRGTLVGFRFPQFLEGVNASGYHFHFITDDKQAGGHVLNCSGEDLQVQLAPAGSLMMEMPEMCRQGASVPR
jgi:acetolactate decarboxylase